MIGQYIHGNEPSHHLAYLYMYAGAPLKTQARLKQIVDSQYKPSPDGLVGNDDLGQMSAWLVFTSLGFYPVAPGSNQYVLGRPFVDRAILHLPNGKLLTDIQRWYERNTELSERRTTQRAIARSKLCHARGADAGWRVDSSSSAAKRMLHGRFVRSCRPTPEATAR